MTQYKPEECAFAFNPDENKMSLTLPDSRIVRLIYNCRVNGAGGENMDVGNRVWLEGHEDITDAVNTKFLIHEHTGNVGSGSTEFMLQKQNAYNFRVLPGVSFELYGDTVRQGSNTITVGGKKLYYYATFTTDQNGMVMIEEDGLAAGHLYALRELDPPPGYLPQETPYLFYMENVPNGTALDVDIVAEGALVVIKNYAITYELPKTGGAGSGWLVMGGLALCLTALSLLYRKRRREDPFSPESIL